MERFKVAARIFAKALADHSVGGEGLPTYGTNAAYGLSLAGSYLVALGKRNLKSEHAFKRAAGSLEPLIGCPSSSMANPCCRTMWHKL